MKTITFKNGEATCAISRFAHCDSGLKNIRRIHLFGCMDNSIGQYRLSTNGIRIRVEIDQDEVMFEIDMTNIPIFITALVDEWTEANGPDFRLMAALAMRATGKKDKNDQID